VPSEVEDTFAHGHMRTPTALAQVKLQIQAAKAGRSFGLRCNAGFADTALHGEGLRGA
jgi:hypothetical protein